MATCKITACPTCGGHVRAESIGWKCEKCQGFIDMQGNFYEHEEKPFMPTVTNADRIRSMSDEELAFAIICPKDMGADIATCTHNCIECCLRWLQHPAKED